MKQVTQATVVDHLIELRRRLLISVAAVFVCAIIVTMFHNQIVDFLITPYQDATDNPKLLSLDPLAGLGFRIKVATVGGIALASPILFWEAWRFIVPALHKRERRYAIPFILSATLLFIAGASVAYFTLPRALDFLARVGGSSLTQTWTAQSYLNLFIFMLVGFGLAFEFPVILMFLLLIRATSTQTLRRYRRQWIVGIFIAAAVITPSQDPISLVMMALPMYVFFETVVIIGRLCKR